MSAFGRGARSRAHTLSAAEIGVRRPGVTVALCSVSRKETDDQFTYLQMSVTDLSDPHCMSENIMKRVEVWHWHE
jgi:hypothetical protein